MLIYVCKREPNLELDSPCSEEANPSYHPLTVEPCTGELVDASIRSPAYHPSIVEPCTGELVDASIRRPALNQLQLSSGGTLKSRSMHRSIQMCGALIPNAHVEM